MKADLIEQCEELSMEHAEDARPLPKLDRVIRYATGINRFYWLSCCILIFVLTGLYYSLYPDISMVLVAISLFLGFVCWAVIWLSIIFQIKMWNRAINKIHAA